MTIHPGDREFNCLYNKIVKIADIVTEVTGPLKVLLVSQVHPDSVQTYSKRQRFSKISHIIHNICIIKDE